MINYPFTKCLKPRRIINPYTRESLIVECGHCPACSFRKSSLNAMKLKLECLSHKFNMFLTLTYNNVSLPRMMLKACNRYLDDCGEVCDSGEQFSLVDITQRLGTQGTILGRTPDFYFVKYVLPNKVNLPSGILPHLSKYDAQLFIKRLRKNLDSYFLKKYGTKAPKIRYYLVGEYGPVHFRPHYHVVLSFDNEEIFQVIRQVVYKSWPFGRIDCQKSLNKCADYVAKYVNSNMSLPDIFKLQQTRPFAIHSTHLGEKVLEMPLEEIYENEFESVIKRRIPNFATDSDVFMWRSLKTFYFPKCKGFSEKSEYERLYSYTTYEKASRLFGTDCVAQQARNLTEIILHNFYHDKIYDIGFSKLIDYFIHSSSFDPYSYEKKEFRHHIDDVCRRIYCELRLSKHFTKFVCNDNPNLYLKMLRKIDSFWKDNDAFNLKNQLTNIAAYGSSEWFECEDEYQYFYHNIGFDFDKYKTFKFFRMFEHATSVNAENAVKHKKLNDLNKIFENR